MASAHIEIDGASTRQNRILRTFIDQLQGVQNDVDQIKATFDQLALGADWPALAVALKRNRTRRRSHIQPHRQRPNRTQRHLHHPAARETWLTKTFAS